MILFMGFIVTLVILMMKPHKADSLIEANYYEKGQTFDRDYNATHAARRDSMIPAIQAGIRNLSITFRESASYKIALRSLANASRDKTIYSDAAKKEVLIPLSELKSGSWLLRIEYTNGQEEYLYQDKLLLP